VHKAQGSEFDRVVVVLPGHDCPVLTRELVYTGVTRARRAVAIWASREALTTAIGRRVTRSSGLRDALWGAGTVSGGAGWPATS
jgi:exodeoxyribonuclease V alpha subunit